MNKWCYAPLLILTMLIFISCHKGGAPQVKQEKSIAINILYLEDESAPKLTGADLENIIKYTRNYLGEYYDVRVGKINITQSNIERVFNNKAYKVRNFLTYRNNVDRLVEVLSAKMSVMDLKQKLKFVPGEYVEYVKRHNEVPLVVLKNICVNALEKNSKLLLTEQINKNQNENIFYYIWNFWLNKIKDLNDYDLVIFNGFVVENLENFERDIMPIHVFARGGLSFGFTER